MTTPKISSLQSSKKPRRILACDYGAARIGLASTDEEGRFAMPSGRIECKGLDMKVKARKVFEIAQSKHAGTIVVGIAYQLDGGHSLQTRACLEFYDALRSLAEISTDAISIDSLDERLTSKQADKLLATTGAKRKKRHESIDEVSAWVILDTYLALHTRSIDSL